MRTRFAALLSLCLIGTALAVVSLFGDPGTSETLTWPLAILAVAVLAYLLVDLVAPELRRRWSHAVIWTIAGLVVAAQVAWSLL